jgi:subtilase family serine protease
VNPTVRRGLTAVAAGLLVVGSVAGTASAASSRSALAGSVPSWAKAANFKAASNPNAQVGFRVYLGLRDEAGAEAVARAVSDPRSAAYGKYLSPAAFRQRFARSQSDVAAVQTWLRSQGFKVDYTPTNNLFVAAEGTVAQAAVAFGTHFNDYRVSGLTVRSPATALTVPSALAPLVTGVIGLDDSAAFVHFDHPKNDAPPSPGFVNAPPCSTYWAEKLATTLPQAYGATQPYAPCGYTPTQLRGAYGTTSLIDNGTDGRGQTVAIIDAYASPTIFADVNEWSANRGIAPLAPSQFAQVVPPGIFNKPQSNAQDPQGWYGEETLDVEAVHGMAPGAKIVYVGAPNNYRDLDAVLVHTIDRHLASIITNSYGFPLEELPRGYILSVEPALVQAAATGIGVYFSSGDGGDESNVVGFSTPDWPASSPWVTSVGGTSLAVGASNDYLFETGWMTTKATLANNSWGSLPGSFLYGSGGGVSCVFPRPSYQTSAAITTTEAGRVCGSFAGRVGPDISLDGDPNTGYLVGQTQSFPGGPAYGEFRLGGTSLSSPLLAGIIALADQANGAPHGFLNPVLYANKGTTAFRDVTDPAHTVAVVRVDFVNGVDASDGTTTSLRTMNQTQVGHTDVTPGYDDVTGLGSPNGAAFIQRINQ